MLHRQLQQNIARDREHLLRMMHCADPTSTQKTPQQVGLRRRAEVKTDGWVGLPPLVLELL